MANTTGKTAQEFWEGHYRGSPAGTGRPNPILVEVASALTPGSALDLGSGGGGDALWLAERGWSVTAVDVSPTALTRLSESALAAGLSARVQVELHDLATSTPEGPFDLLSAQYLHSPIALDRASVLRRLAGQVRVGGVLLVVDHASAPPWSWADPATTFPSPEQTLVDLGLDLDAWRVDRVDAPQREAVGPGGQRAVVTDNVVVLTKQVRA